MSERLDPKPQSAESARTQLLDIIEDGWWDHEAFAIERSGVEQVLARLESAVVLAAQERVAALEGLTCDCRHFLVVLAESRAALAKPLDVTP